MTRRLELMLPAVVASVREARNAVCSVAAELGAGTDVVDDMRLCVSEVATNVVRHAYGADSGDFAVRVDHEGDELTVVVRDDGRGLTRFQLDGELGYGLRIIERVASRCALASTPEHGTEVQLVFALRDSPESA